MAGLRKILLVEDDPQIAEIYTTALKRDGYEVANAVDYDGALAQAKAFQPDLIFMDIMIPGRSGLEALHTLRTDPQYDAQKKKIVLLTNLGENEQVTKALDSNQVDGYVIKADIVPHELSEIIKSFEGPAPADSKNPS